MKHNFTLVIALLFSLSVFAQLPQTYPGNGNVSPLVNGVVADGNLTLSDDGDYLTVVFAKGPAPMTHELVIYIQSNGTGFTSTQNFTDSSNLLKKGISGYDGTNRAVFNFDPSFNPLYAIAFNPRPQGNTGQVVQLVENGKFITTQAPFLIENGTDVNASSYTFKVKLKAIGIPASSAVSFKFMATYINRSFRYEEAIGDPMTGFVEGANPYTSTTPPLVYNGSSISSDASTLDSLALVQFYDSTNGTNSVANTNWLTTAPLSSWYGVTVTNNRVTKLELPANNLSGALPTIISDLDTLQVFDLNHNSLGGKIPNVLNYLSDLTYVDLSHNQFTDVIPRFDSLRKLSVFDMSNNQFTGVGTLLISNLDSLKELRLDSNNISGTISPEIGKITNLTVLDLSQNQYSGTIPPQLGKLTNLTFLSFANNQLTGEIPGGFGNLSNLTELNFSSNQLSGKIPIKLGYLSKLLKLFFNDNMLSGEIPSTLGSLSSIQVLGFNRNQLTGKIPDAFQSLVTLTKLNFRDNLLSDTVPLFLTTLPNLNFLGLISNHFTFDGMEAMVQHNFDTLEYKNERLITLHKNGQTLSVYAGGTLSNNTYNWYKDGALVATITGDSTYNYTGAGEYYVTVTNSIATDLTLTSNAKTFGGPDSFAQDDASAKAIAGIKSGYSIYPNPVTSIATVSFDLKGKCSINVTDISGRPVLTKTVVGTGKSMVQLDVSKLSSGLYFVTINNDKNEKKTLPLNKQ